MPNPRAQRPLSLQAVTEDIRSLAQPAQAMLDMLAGAAKGSVSATVGLPGDIESLGRGIASAFRAPSGQRLDAFSQGMEQPTVLPTTENVSAKLPAVVPTTAPLSRQHSAEYGQTAGEFIPTPGSGRAVKGGLSMAGQALNDRLLAGQSLTPFINTPAPITHVVKPKGGNWFGKNVEHELKSLKTPMNPDEVAGIEEHFKKIEPFYDLNNPASVRELADMRQHIEVMKRNEAVNNWVDRNLTNYVKKEMATPEDPVRKLAEQGVTHYPIAGEPGYWERHGRRAREDFGGEEMAQSPLAKQWENRTDAMIMRDTAQQHQDMMHLSPGMYSDKDEWIKKLAPDTPLYSADQNKFNQLDLGFDHIIDVLKQDLAEGRIRPEQLNKVSMEQAVRRAYEYDQEMAKKMREAAIKQTEGMPVHKEYPEGYRWIELSTPEPKLGEGYRVIKDEPSPSNWKVVPHPDGDGYALRADNGQYAFGNQSYAERKWSTPEQARAEIPNYAEIQEPYPDEVYKILDSSGNIVSKAETEKKALNQLNREEREKVLADALKYEGNTMGHCVGGYCPDVLEGRSRIYSLRDAKGEPHVTVEVQPVPKSTHDKQKWFGQQSSEVQQKINAEVDDLMSQAGGDGRGHAQAFSDVVSRYFTDTPPRIVQIKGKQNRAPNEEYLPYVQDFVRGGQWSDVGDIQNTGMRATKDIFSQAELQKLRELGEVDMPHIMTGEDIQRYHNMIVPEGKRLKYDSRGNIIGSEADEGMKRGGKVSISDNPDTMMIDVEDKRYDKGGEIKATPRSEGWGMAADLIKAIEGASKEQFGLKNPATEEIANFLMIPELARTLERKAYGQPITNIGKANVPLIPEDTSGALEAVAPLTGLARKGAKAVGKSAASEVEKAMFGESRVGALNAMTPQVMSVYKPHTPKKPDPDVGTRYKVTDQGGLAPKQDLDIQSLKDSQVKIFPWDATSRNKLVTEVSDIPLTNPVLTEGGDDYMRDLNHISQRIAGASNYDIANRIMTRINEAAMENQLLGNGTGKVYGFSSRMGEGAEMASTFPTDIALDLIKQAGLKKKELKALDENMRNMNFEGKKGIFQNMAPFGSDEFIHQLRHGLETNKEKKIKGFSAMNMRKAFMDRMSLVENQKRLDYNIQDLANSVLADELKGVPKGYVGNSVAELDAFGKLTPSKSSTYNTDFPGVYAGNMANMPVEILMPKTFENIYREMKHLYPDATKESLRNMAVGAMEKRNKGISEKIGQRNIDAVKTYQEGLKNGEFDPNDIKQVYDYMLRKKLQLKMAGGGEVHGLSTNDLLFLQSQQDIGKMRPQAQREYITNMGGKELRQRMELKRANGGEITADDLTIEERPL